MACEKWKNAFGNISRAKSFEELFMLWKKAHKEIGLNLNKFYPDGVVNDEAYFNSNPRVLYVLKEPNSGNDVSEGDFWFKRQVENKSHHIIPTRIKIMQKVINGNRDLNFVAYININKYGGLNRTNGEKLKEYAYSKEIRPLIKKQIELLAPDIVVCCGVYEIVKEILSENPKSILVNMWHPSYKFTNHQKYKEVFEKRFSELNIGEKYC